MTPAPTLHLLPLPPLASSPDGMWEHMWAVVPMHIVVVLWWVALLAVYRPNPRVIAPVVVGLLLRLATGETVLMGADYPDTRYLEATGGQIANPLYGGTWTAFMGIIWYLSGAWPTFLTATNLAISTFTIALADGVCERFDPELDPRIASWTMALMPLSVAMSSTHTMFGLAAMLQGTAALGLLSLDRRAGSALAALSMGLLLHLRPLQAIAVALGMLVLLHRRRWAAVSTVALFIAWRIAELMSVSPPQPNSSPVKLAQALLGPGSSVAPLDPLVVPAAFTVLAIMGARRHPVLGAAYVFAALPYAMYHRPTDILRFALPSMFWVSMLVAAGMRPTWRRPLMLAVPLSLAVSWSPLPEAPWRDEHTALREAPVTDEDEVHFDSTRISKHRAWLTLRLQGTWTPTEVVPSGALFWRDRFGSPGLTCAASDPVWTRTLVDRANRIEPPIVATEIGLFRCR